MAPQLIEPGTHIASRFTVEGQLGSGALGMLYLVFDQNTKERVTLRMLRDELSRSEVVVENLRTQVRRVAHLSHKNIARVFGFGKHGSTRYLVTEHVDGHSLRELIARKRQTGATFSPKGTYNVIAHVCNALRAGIEIGSSPPLFHGLPGPSAIRVNNTGRVKLCDFGIISAIPAGTSAVNVLSDAYCMAPEMRNTPESTTGKADIFTLGALILELLTGQPFDNRRPLGAQIKPLSPPIADVVARCLHADPVRRYAHPEALKVDLYEATESAEAVQDTPSDPALGDSAAYPVMADPPATAVPPPPPLAQKTPATPAPRTPEVYAAPQPSAPQDYAATPAPHTQQIHGQHSPPNSAFAVPGAPAPLAMQMTGPQLAPPNNLGPIAPIATSPGDPAYLKAHIEQLLTDPRDLQGGDRWILRKDGCDFGPFGMAEVKQQIYRGDFNGSDQLYDRETDQSIAVRQHPALGEFAQLVDQFKHVERRQQAEHEANKRSKRRRLILFSILALSVTTISVGGGVLYFLTRNPKVVVKEVPGQPQEARLKLDITWKNEPAAQAARRKKIRRRKRRTGAGAGDENVTHLGDVSQAGGDQLLSQSQIQSVMERNLKKLAHCVLNQARVDPSLKSVSIDFGVKGAGTVSYVKVNGLRDGPFHACIERGMKRISFPKYDGVVTRASFSMSLQR